MGDKVKIEPNKNSRDPRQTKVPNTVIKPAVMPSKFATEENSKLITDNTPHINQNTQKLPIPPYPTQKVTNTPELKKTHDTTLKNNNSSQIELPRVTTVYTVGQVKGKTDEMVVVTEKKEIYHLKTKNKDEATTDIHYLIINIEPTNKKTHGFPEKINGVPSITGKLMHGKTFELNKEDALKTVLAKGFKLEGIEEEVPNATPDMIKNMEKYAKIPRLRGKTIFVSKQIFQGNQNVKIKTEDGTFMLISVKEKHHFKLLQNKIYDFFHLSKSGPWKSEFPVFEAIDLNHKMIAHRDTKFKEIDHDPKFNDPLPEKPPKKEGLLICFEASVNIFDQCTMCLKRKTSGECRNRDCIQQGKIEAKNTTFVVNFIVDEGKDEFSTMSGWKNQLQDFQATEQALEEPYNDKLLLKELEAHYLPNDEPKHIYYYTKPNSQNNNGETLVQVTTSP